MNFMENKMFETKRLFLKLLNLSQLKLWVNNISMLEVELIGIQL